LGGAVATNWNERPYGGRVLACAGQRLIWSTWRCEGGRVTAPQLPPAGGLHHNCTVSSPSGCGNVGAPGPSPMGRIAVAMGSRSKQVKELNLLGLKMTVQSLSCRPTGGLPTAFWPSAPTWGSAACAGGTTRTRGQALVTQDEGQCRQGCGYTRRAEFASSTHRQTG